MKRLLAIAALALVSTSLTFALASSIGQLAIYQITSFGGKKLDVASTAFGDGRAIPEIYSAYDKGISPPVSWSYGPEGTRSYVLIVEDPAAPTARPFVHWVVFNIPAGTTVLDEDLSAGKANVTFGKNGTGSIGYFGPRPPEGDRPHPYHFQVFALDTQLDLPRGADRDAIVQAMKGHVIALGEITGRYARPGPASPEG